MAQDIHRRALEQFDDAQEDVREQYDLMRADMRFSNPAAPNQWDAKALELRNGRPCLTFDRTNQFIAQVVNQGRQNKPAIHCLPANSEAAIEVAEKLNGIIRHVEYVSRAGIAYDCALENAARIGLGWLRVVPEIMRPENNEQEIRIKRVHDPLSVYLEAGWAEPDGSDAEHGFIETLMTERQFKAAFPKAKMESFERDSAPDGWYGDKRVRVCEYFDVEKKTVSRLSIRLEGQSMTVSEDEYWQLRMQTGIEIPAAQFEAQVRTVKWRKLSGCEVLEETDFPSQYLPIIPVIGHEVWVDGKRHLCGMTRRLMDSQRAYNYERSAFIESVAMQPKAPYMAPAQAIEGYEKEWAALNSGNPSMLPYNHIDESGNPMPAPTRQMPPAFPAAFAQGGQIASQDMESAVGMFRANLGAPGAATSGRAKREDKVAGDTANFHYQDNLSRSIEQLGRVIVDMIPRVIDTPRQARIVGEDGTNEFVHVDPEMQQAVQKQGKKVVSINPSVGAYDVRDKTGPAYTTLREESAEQLANMMQAAPDLMPILGDLWVGMQDWPEAEVAKKRLAAMLPPQIQKMESEDGEEIPPAAQAQMAMLQQQVQELSQALEAAHAEHMQIEQQLNDKSRTEQIKAQSESEKQQVMQVMEQMRQETAIQVAQINAESKHDVAELSGMVQLLIAKLNPPADANQVAESEKV
jgi:hypothetical protein